MHNFALFLGDVLAHWVASMSGAVSLGFAIYEVIKQKKIEAWAFFAIALIVIFNACNLAWQDEHRNAEILTAEKRSATGDANFWKQQSYQKDAALSSRDQLLNQNYTALIGEQATSNKSQQSLSDLSSKILDINKPEKQKFTTRREDGDTSIFAGYKHYTDFFVLTNQSVPANILVQCERSFEILEAKVIEGGPKYPTTTLKIDDKTQQVRIPSPPISINNPLMVTLGSNADGGAGICAVAYR